jgi:hypothetical protein
VRCWGSGFAEERAERAGFSDRGPDAGSRMQQLLRIIQPRSLTSRATDSTCVSSSVWLCHKTATTHPNGSWKPPGWAAPPVPPDSDAKSARIHSADIAGPRPKSPRVRRPVRRERVRPAMGDVRQDEKRHPGVSSGNRGTSANAAGAPAGRARGESGRRPVTRGPVCRGAAVARPEFKPSKPQPFR